MASTQKFANKLKIRLRLPNQSQCAKTLATRKNIGSINNNNTSSLNPLSMSQLLNRNQAILKFRKENNTINNINNINTHNNSFTYPSQSQNNASTHTANSQCNVRDNNRIYRTSVLKFERKQSEKHLNINNNGTSNSNQSLLMSPRQTKPSLTNMTSMINSH